MTKKEIGLVLKRLRTSCGMTQKEIAEKIGRTQQIIGHWETGYSQPDANTLFNLCNIYGVTVDDAFGFQKSDNISCIETSYGKSTKEALNLYIQLDSDDQGEIRGEMKQMLKAEKYSTKKPKHA